MDNAKSLDARLAREEFEKNRQAAIERARRIAKLNIDVALQNFKAGSEALARAEEELLRAGLDGDLQLLREVKLVGNIDDLANLAARLAK